MSKLFNDYLEAIMHDAPPVGRKEWEAAKEKKLKLEQEKDKLKRDKHDLAIAKDYIKNKKQKDLLKRKYEILKNKLIKEAQKVGFDIAQDRVRDDIKECIRGGNRDKDSIISTIQNKNSDYSWEAFEINAEQRKILQSEINDVSSWIADYVYDGTEEFVKSKQFKQILDEELNNGKA